jgi:hypothetical protein
MSQQAAAQERARSYFQSKAALPASAVREQIAAAFGALDATLGTASPEHAARRAIPGEWSVQEIVDHLLETYRPGVDELRCLLAGQRPPGEPIPAAVQSKAPLLRPWPWLLDELRRTHHAILELIDSVPPDLVIECRAPFTMVVNVPGAGGAMQPIHWIEEVEWKAYAIASWRLHAIDHMKQARKVLAACR